MDFLKTNFDKILLVGLFLVMVGISEQAIHSPGTDMSSINWLENVDGQILAALLALMAGRAFTPKSNGGVNGKTNDQGNTGNPVGN